MPPKKEREKNQNIQVVLRCRPLNSNEKSRGHYSIVDCAQKEVHVKERVVATPVKTFNFDRVFGPNSKQTEVYRQVVTPIVDEVLSGYNCTIFAYGQTGTGKTFTMEGERTDDPNISWEKDPLAGIIPRSMNQIFTKLHAQGCEFSVRVSFLEIYNEELIDLLGAESVDNPRLKIYEDTARKGSCVIQGLEEVVVRNKNEVYSILQKGAERRQTAATLMNAHSSRSHSLFMVTIHMKESSIDGEELLKTGKLNLVDLAGSECIGKSGAVDKRAREAGNINQSLLTLGRVITALVEHAPHIPYRESKLTRLLQDSLGGRTKTSIIATIGPSNSYLDETLSTLDYAHRAKNIMNRPEINQKFTKKALLKEYNEEIERLRRDLQAARDKNGVYIAEENYLEMQNRLEQQADIIKDLDGKLSLLNEDHTKLEDLYAEVNEELVEKTETLQETEVTLKTTQTSLRRTRQDRDEQKHLLTNHVATENTLSSQAKQLLSTADVSTSDCAGLHAKIGRKTTVEETNEAAKSDFRTQFHRSVDTMQDQLRAFTSSQQGALQGMHTRHGELADLEQQSLLDLLSGLGSMQARVTSGVQDIHTHRQEELQATNEWVTQLTDFCNATKAGEVKRQTTFHEESFTQILSILSSQTHKMQQHLQHQRRQLDTQMQQQQLAITEFCHQLGSQCDKQKSLLDEYLVAKAAQLDDTELKAQQRSEQLTTLSQTLMAETLARVQRDMQQALAAMVTKQCSEVKESTENLVTDLAQNRQHSQQFGDDATSLISGMKQDVSSAQTRLVTQSSDLQTESLASTDKMLSEVEEAEKTESELQNTVSTFAEETQTLVGIHLSRVEQLAAEHVAQQEAATASHSIRTQAVCTECDNGVEAVTTKHKESTAVCSSRIQAEKESLVCEQEHSRESCAKLLTELDQRDSDVEKFVFEQLQKDKPTGMTPQPRTFSYPKKLEATQRHSLLLTHFRQQYVLDEAMNTPIPDDSFGSQPDIPQLVFDDDGETQESDSNDTSVDSAISGTSITSSMVSNDDKGSESLDSNRENMAPPNGLPHKPRGMLKKLPTPSSRSTSQGKKTTPRSTPTHTPKKTIASKTTNTRFPLRSNNNP